MRTGYDAGCGNKHSSRFPPPDKLYVDAQFTHAAMRDSKGCMMQPFLGWLSDGSISNGHVSFCPLHAFRRLSFCAQPRIDCHSERSEESPVFHDEILRCAQDDISCPGGLGGSPPLKRREVLHPFGMRFTLGMYHNSRIIGGYPPKPPGCHHPVEAWVAVHHGW